MRVLGPFSLCIDIGVLGQHFLDAVVFELEDLIYGEKMPIMNGSERLA